jgi:hypothetical protein
MTLYPACNDPQSRLKKRQNAPKGIPKVSQRSPKRAKTTTIFVIANYFPKVLPGEPTISQKYYLQSQLFPESTTWRANYFPKVLHGEPTIQLFPKNTTCRADYFPKVLPGEPTISQKYYLEREIFPRSTTWNSA